MDKKQTAQPLCEDEIRNSLPPMLRDIEIYVFEKIDSTNTYARALALSGAHGGTLVLAEEQSSGRGRHGKDFYSPAGTGIYMSLILRPDELSDCDTQMLTVAAAVAVCRALEALTAVRPQIKWVNDIYADGKKLCGILCEALPKENGEIDAVIAGIGINCTTESFPDELSQTAGALGAEISRNELAARVYSELFSVISLDGSEQLEEYKSRSLMEGRRVRFVQGGKAYEGTACGIAENGNLLVKLDDGELLSLCSGEVSVKGLSAWR